VQVWDRGMVSKVEKAIRDSGLGLNPSNDGNLVRVPIPALSEERRQELVKVAGRYAEQARVAVRNVRRDGMEELKRAQKEGEISEDEQRRAADEIQKATDEHIKAIDDALATKESEILQV
jgi:ribosome recycling factor